MPGLYIHVYKLHIFQVNPHASHLSAQVFDILQLFSKLKLEFYSASFNDWEGKSAKGKMGKSTGVSSSSGMWN